MDRDEEAKNMMQEIAKNIESKLPEGMGFCLLAFDFGDKPLRRLNYVSNAEREDIVKTMKEWIAKTEGNFGKHVDNSKPEWLDFENLLKQNFGFNQKIWCLNKLDFSDFLTTFGAIKEAQQKGYDWSDYQFTKVD
jgi:hypothetical protein